MCIHVYTNILHPTITAKLSPQNLYTCNTTIQLLIYIFIRNIRKIGMQSIKTINKPSIDAMIDDSCPNLVHEIDIKRTKTPPEGLIKANTAARLPQKTLPKNKKSILLGVENGVEMT